FANPAAKVVCAAEIDAGVSQRLRQLDPIRSGTKVQHWSRTHNRVSVSDRFFGACGNIIEKIGFEASSPAGVKDAAIVDLANMYVRASGSAFKMKRWKTREQNVAVTELTAAQAVFNIFHSITIRFLESPNLFKHGTASGKKCGSYGLPLLHRLQIYFVRAAAHEQMRG